MNSVQEQLLESIKSGNFLEVAIELYHENWGRRKEIAIEVAKLHNEQALDVPAEFLNLKNVDQSDHFFVARSIFEDALPSLEAPVINVMKCIKHLTEEIDQDSIAGMLLTPFITFCEKSDNRPNEVLEFAIKNHTQWQGFISPALIAGSRISLEEYLNKAINLSQHDSVDVSASAVLAMERLNYGDNLKAVNDVIKTLSTVVQKHQDDQLFASVLESVFAMYKKDNAKEREVLSILSTVLSNPGDVTLHAASRLLMLEKEALPNSLISLLLTAFEYIKPEDNKTLRCLDHGLEYLLKTGRGKDALSLIETLLIKHGQKFSLSSLGSFSREIVKNEGDILNWILTRWLLADNIILGCSSILLIKDNIGEKTELAADLSNLDLGAGKALMLAKRACGWLFSKPVCAMSFIMSLVDSLTKEEEREISNILFNPILVSYSGSGKEYLKTLTENTSVKVKSMANELLRRLEKYHDGLRAVQGVKELKPSIANREAYARKMNREINASYKEAHKSSILADLIGKPLVLLYGNSSIYYVHGSSGGESIRNEMTLQNISTSFEFPSLENLDPHSLESMLLSFRWEGYR